MGTLRRQRGLTLIEILIALIILMVGLVGVFALFPVGIRSTQESVEDSTAAVLAESFQHALIAAMRASRSASGPADRVPVVFCHDGLPGTTTNYPAPFAGGTTFDASTGLPGGPALPDNTYVFALPSEQDGAALYTYPRPGTGSPSTPMRALFRMADGGASEAYLRKCLVGTGTMTSPTAGSVRFEDASEGIDQYSVCFDVVRVRDAMGGYAQPLFEFRIGVYRNYQDRGLDGWTINANPGGAPWPGPSPSAPNGHPDLRKVFRTMIAGN